MLGIREEILEIKIQLKILKRIELLVVPTFKMIVRIV